MARIWNKHKQTNTPLKRKVFVGLSGGVDSSVSAALLKNAGYDVTGVFIKVWHPEFLPCNWKEDRLDAMRVCAKLGIPFITFDFESEYKKEVVDYMIEEYRKGRTPNPDVSCNKYIKFGIFLKKAISLGADYVATGHYAQIKKEKDGKYILEAGNDNNKDQSYFLWTLNQQQLNKIIFPVGCLEKPQVRKLAKKYGLQTAEKKDSQGICFVGKVNLKDFLSKFIKAKKGKVLNKNGEIIGSHPGVFFFTLGQRHGFTINKKTNFDKPYYIVSKDIKKNILIVSNKVDKNNNLADINKIKLENTNWISSIPVKNKEYGVRIRYRQQLEKAIINYKSGNNAIIIFNKMTQGVAEGQSAVVYDGKKCLGGGVIKGGF